MSKVFQDPFSLIIIIFVASSFLYAMYYQWKVRSQGTEAEGYVTRIEEVTHSDSDGISTSYDFYVVYVTKDGRQIEGCISNPVSNLEVGDHVKLKYLDSDTGYPVFISKL